MNLTLLPEPRLPATPAWFYRLDPGLPSSPRVLMIEDDLTIATMYRLQLQSDGFEVQLATDGASGLHLAQQSPPDMVLLDIRLPKMPGIEVMRAISSDPRLAQLPVLILSNYSDPALVKESLDLGARDYLVKSQTTPDALSRKIRDHLSAE
jgi:CheY-like chemotaxis protein